VSTRPDPVKFEALARGVASGLSVRASARRAGYSPRSEWSKHLAARPEFKARVETLRREIALASPNLAPVIVALLDAAELALRDRKGDYGAVARMLAEAARLKQKLPPAPAPDEETEAEWAARWGPKT